MATAETVVKTPAIPGLELHLPKGTVIRDEQGEVVRTITITPIPLDRTPFTLPSDATFNMYFTIQPGGAYLHTYGPAKGAWLVYPNTTSFPLGTRVQFYNYDPDGRGWHPYGMGVVTPTQVIPEPKTRLYAFTGASFNSGPSAPAGGAYAGREQDRRPGGPIDGRLHHGEDGSLSHGRDAAGADAHLQLAGRVRPGVRPGDDA